MFKKLTIIGKEGDIEEIVTFSDDFEVQYLMEEPTESEIEEWKDYWQ